MEILHRLHSIDLEKELGGLPALPNMYIQMDRVQRLQLMAKEAEGLDTDERLLHNDDPKLNHTKLLLSSRSHQYDLHCRLSCTSMMHVYTNCTENVLPIPLE